jgi:LL-diaminopimelate aminotransferase
MVGNAQAVELLGRVKSNFDYGIFLPIQHAAIAALTGPQDCVAAMAAEYERRRDIIVEGFNSFGWKAPRPKASMYVWAPVPTKQDSFSFAASLIENAGVAVVPVSGSAPTAKDMCASPWCSRRTGCARRWSASANGWDNI